MDCGSCVSTGSTCAPNACLAGMSSAAAMGTKSGAIIAASEAARTNFFNLFAILGLFAIMGQFQFCQRALRLRIKAAGLRALCCVNGGASMAVDSLCCRPPFRSALPQPCQQGQNQQWHRRAEGDQGPCGITGQED